MYAPIRFKESAAKKQKYKCSDLDRNRRNDGFGCRDRPPGAGNPPNRRGALLEAAEVGPPYKIVTFESILKSLWVAASKKPPYAKNLKTNFRPPNRNADYRPESWRSVEFGRLRECRIWTSRTRLGGEGRKPGADRTIR